MGIYIKVKNINYCVVNIGLGLNVFKNQKEINNIKEKSNVLKKFYNNYDYFGNRQNLTM